MLPDVAAHIEQGRELRTRLLEERRACEARIVEIDVALEHLGGAGDELPVARQVVEVLERAPAPMTSGEVQRALPRVGRLAILGALCRLSKRGAIQAAGRKGGQRYSVALTGGGEPA